jgi:hypothetical protein
MPTMSFGRLSTSNGRPRARVHQAGLASPHLPGRALGADIGVIPLRRGCGRHAWARLAPGVTHDR